MTYVIINFPRIVFFFCFVFIFSGQTVAMTASEIMAKVDARDTGKSSVSNTIMILIDKKDRKRVREIQLFSKEYSDVDKSVSFFKAPADVRGTSYMSFNWENSNKEDDSWLYLPALQKVNRIASSDRSGSFMGSDFTYTDIDGFEFSDYTYEMKKESDIVDGKDCWVIELNPRSKEVINKTGYLKSVQWIRKDIYFAVKGRILVKKGKKVKLFLAKDLNKINGIWTAKTLQMITTKNKKIQHKSIFQLKDIKYNVPVEDSLFATEAMRRGL
jgi:outer membrane lipoprotein-sorting protein